VSVIFCPSRRYSKNTYYLLLGQNITDTFVHFCCMILIILVHLHEFIWIPPAAVMACPSCLTSKTSPHTRFPLPAPEHDVNLDYRKWIWDISMQYWRKNPPTQGYGQKHHTHTPAVRWSLKRGAEWESPDAPSALYNIYAESNGFTCLYCDWGSGKHHHISLAT